MQEENENDLTQPQTDTAQEETPILTREEYKSLINRLSRIEGQVRGIKKMMEKDVNCPDIMLQVSAVNAALNSFNKELLSVHLHTYVAENIREGNDEVIDDLMISLYKMMK